MVRAVSSSGNIGPLLLLDNAPAPALTGGPTDNYTLVCPQETRIDAKHLE
jgi:hypothetical protein